MSKQLIESLGGAKQVATDLNVSPGAVRNWMMESRAVPWKYRPAVARLAAQRAIPLPEDFWAEVAA